MCRINGVGVGVGMGKGGGGWTYPVDSIIQRDLRDCGGIFGLIPQIAGLDEQTIDNRSGINEYGRLMKTIEHAQVNDKVILQTPHEKNAVYIHQPSVYGSI